MGVGALDAEVGGAVGDTVGTSIQEVDMSFLAISTLRHGASSRITQTSRVARSVEFMLFLKQKENFNIGVDHPLEEKCIHTYNT